MYQEVNILIIVLFSFLYIRRKKAVNYKFGIKAYLATLSETERKSFGAYLAGALMVGAVIPAFIWAIDAGSNLAIKKISRHQTSRIEAYSYIGWCHINNGCLSSVLNKPLLLDTDDERMVIVGQIKSYMVAEEKNQQGNEQKQNFWKQK